jgi:hypothetical protein
MKIAFYGHDGGYYVTVLLFAHAQLYLPYKEAVLISALFLSLVPIIVMPLWFVL